MAKGRDQNFSTKVKMQPILNNFNSQRYERKNSDPLLSPSFKCHIHLQNLEENEYIRTSTLTSKLCLFLFHHFFFFFDRQAVNIIIATAFIQRRSKSAIEWRRNAQYIGVAMRSPPAHTFFMIYYLRNIKKYFPS